MFTDTGGTTAKNIKMMPDQGTFDPNSLIEMPDHIIQTIFDFLDLADKLSFSECCTQFNGILNQRKNLDKIWLEVPVSQRQLIITLRPYSNVVWNYEKVEKISNRLWKHLAPNLTSVRLTEFDRDDSTTVRSFLDALPHFANLTHLDCDISFDFLEFMNDQSVKTKQSLSGLVEMKNLEHLRMHFAFFCIIFRDNYCCNHCR